VRQALLRVLVIVCAACYLTSTFVFKDYWVALQSALLVVLVLLALVNRRVDESRIHVKRVVEDVEELSRSIRELDKAIADLYNNYLLLSSRVDYVHVTSPSYERVRGLEVDVKRLRIQYKELKDTSGSIISTHQI